MNVLDKLRRLMGLSKDICARCLYSSATITGSGITPGWCGNGHAAAAPSHAHAAARIACSLGECQWFRHVDSIAGGDPVPAAARCTQCGQTGDKFSTDVGANRQGQMISSAFYRCRPCAHVWIIEEVISCPTQKTP
jgi:hypothetical protein